MPSRSRNYRSSLLASVASISLVVACSGAAQAQVVDPGPRGGPAGAGGPLNGLTKPEVAFWAGGLAIFQEIASVSGTITGETIEGLGPRFNLNQCSGCHSQPAVGGSSPPSNNPQVTVATLDGAQNTVPPFVSLDGPVREARFIKNADGTPDGSVHDLFVITGRTDAPGCSIAQPDFPTQLNNNNVIFRIPTPLFGVGLVEAVPDSDLVAGQAVNSQLMTSLGITAGAFNRNGNDQTITRFGWKAQNKSLLLFAGEADNVEMGVSNELFPNEREDNPSCRFNPIPEDHTNLNPASRTASGFSSDIVNFAEFMRLNAPPVPANQTDPNVIHGRQVFLNIGCQGCHTVNQTTGSSFMTGQSHLTFEPFSDFALHEMGNVLTDHVVQGLAPGDTFRSAPLWGVGQRIFFLHDGRTPDLLFTIARHSSTGSEANSVVNNFNALANADKQALLDFLRSL